MSAAVAKAKSLGWFVSARQSLSARPTLAINGFKKAGIYDVVTELTQVYLLKLKHDIVHGHTTTTHIIV